MKIKDLPISLRPREKALHYGIEQLSDEELLAIIIGSGVHGYSALDIAHDLIKTNLGLNRLVASTYSSLEEQFGLSTNMVLRLLAVFELHNRLNSPMYNHEYKIENSEDIYKRYRYLENYPQEVLGIVMLNKKNVIIKEKILYKGTSEHININPNEIYSELLQSKCKKYVLIHNHPDGNVKPSEEDLLATEVIEKTCHKLLMIMIDHIIIYPGGYYSYRENN